MNGPCALQLKQKMKNPARQKKVQDSHRGSILEEMADLKGELLADGVQPAGIKIYTNDSDLQELLSGSGDASETAADPVVPDDSAAEAAAAGDGDDLGR